MAEQFIGCSLSIKLGGGLGFYQGIVKNVNPATQMITLSKVLHNGKPTHKEVTINSTDILEIKIISREESHIPSKSNLDDSYVKPKQLDEPKNDHSSPSSHPLTNNSNSQVLSPCRPPNKYPESNSLTHPSPIKHLNNESNVSSPFTCTSSSNGRGDAHLNKVHSNFNGSRSSPRKYQKGAFQPINLQFDSCAEFGLASRPKSREKKRRSVGELLSHVSQKQFEASAFDWDGCSGQGNRRPWNKQSTRKRDETTFGIDVDFFNTEFDFEKNLALFDKQAVMEEIQNSRPDVVCHADKTSEPKFRHDENIISAKPSPKRQIIVPAEHVGEILYVTDNGFLIPSVSVEMRMNLLSTANQNGLTKSRQLEMIGRAATEVIISMIGGTHRLEPGNSHQTPLVVILCGANTQGAAGVNCGRQLECQGVETVVISPPIPSSSTPSLLLSQEIQLYSLTSGRLTSQPKTLPSTVDMIVDARFDLNGDLGLPCDSWVTSTNDWVSASRAPLVALDPPNTVSLPFVPKIRLCPSLPLAHPPDKGRVYLMNLNIPQKVFSSIDIKYTSPFGPKMAIPLHTCE